MEIDFKKGGGLYCIGYKCRTPSSPSKEDDESYELILIDQVTSHHTGRLSFSQVQDLRRKYKLEVNTALPDVTTLFSCYKKYSLEAHTAYFRSSFEFIVENNKVRMKKQVLIDNQSDNEIRISVSNSEHEHMNIQRKTDKRNKYYLLDANGKVLPVSKMFMKEIGYCFEGSHFHY